MNNPDHISECLETIFLFKILKFFYADPVSKVERIQIRDGKIRIRDKHPRSAKVENIPKIRKSEKIYKKIVNGLLLVTENKFYECNLTR
jgi:hypothetical protein